MKKFWLPATLAAAGIIASLTAFAATTMPQYFTASMTGSHEVPPVTTKAHGKLDVQFSKAADKMNYELYVSDIPLKNVTAAHLHMAPAGKSGQVVLQLYPVLPAAKKVTVKETKPLAAASVTAKELSGPLHGKSLADLNHELQAGNIYVNVHTKQHPNGEIRGQVTKK